MITLFVIVIIIVLIYESVKKDSKNEHEVQTKLASMPRVEIHSPEMGTFQKLFMEKSCSIDTFIYDQGHLFISLRNGKSISGNINNAFVSFDKFKQNVDITVKINGEKMNFYEYREQFDRSTWRKIYEVLMLAGETRGKSNVKNRFKPGSWF